jgi:acetate kinase
MTARSVLILNAGSASLKWVVLDARTEAVVVDGSASWEGMESERHVAEFTAELDRALQGATSIDAVGHRVVHGGARFRSAVLLDDAVRNGIAELAELAPLHNPAAVAGIDAALKRFGPDIPQVAAFDTAFHATLPREAAVYPVPWEWTERFGVRRFGFHGLSVHYAVERTAALLGALPPRLIVCHLGSGCSVTAVQEGRSIETTMGFTPLEGVMMARRSGSVDPGLILYLLTRKGLSPAEVERGLNEQAGLAGVSGVSADMRKVLAAAGTGHERANLAVAMFVRRIVAAIGALAAVLGGVDALVFTGGIGEHSAEIRARVTAGLAHLGLHLDVQANAARSSDGDVATAASPARILVLEAREDLAILREVRKVLHWD